MNRLQQLARRTPSRSLALGDLAEMMSFGGNIYPLTNQTWTQDGQESAPSSFEGYADQLFGADPVVFSAERIRMAVFSQARFQYRRFEDGRPQQPFGHPSLALLERPWPGGTTANLLKKMLLHADLAGNAYPLRVGNRITLLRPDWCSIVLGSRLEPDDPASAEDAEFVGVYYMPAGKPENKRLYLPGEVGHFAPIPDPKAHYRGMSWLTPVIREVQGDKAATAHKLKFFENAATPNLAVKLDASVTLEQFKEFKELMEGEHRGLANAYKTLYLGGGADVTVVGADFKELDFSATQGKGETRILMAAGVHPVLAGASEGMQGSSLNAGNYSQTRRIFSDVHLQDLWNEASSSLEVLVRKGAQLDSAELMVDSRHIPFMQDDAKDAAEVQRVKAATISSLIDAGYEPASAIAGVMNEDFNLLKHSGLVSVQLQKPGADDADPDEGDE